MKRTGAAADSVVKSVLLTLHVLEALAKASGPMGVSEIATMLGVPRARVHRHLKTLLGAGYASQDASREKYRPGARLYLLGTVAADRFDLLAAARKVMRPLRDRLGHTVSVARVVQNGIMVLEMERSNAAVEISTKPGSIFPFHCSAHGKVVLAFGDAALLAATLRSPGIRATPARARRLENEIAQVRARGWAVAPEEILPGINALAVPVFRAGRLLAGTLAMVDSIRLLAARPAQRQIEALLQAARLASRDLGYFD
jgi:IclR family KDG regulon transcriptional repressor